MSEEKKLRRLLLKFEKEKRRLSDVKIFWKGSIAKRFMTCGNPACKCKTSKTKRHGPYYWWTTKEKNRTKAIIIPKEFLSEAKTYLKNCKQLKKKIYALSELSDEIIEIKLKIVKRRQTKKP